MFGASDLPRERQRLSKHGDALVQFVLCMQRAGEIIQAALHVGVLLAQGAPSHGQHLAMQSLGVLKTSL